MNKKLTDIYRETLIYLKGRGRHKNIASSIAVKYKHGDLLQKFEVLCESNKLLPLCHNNKPEIEVFNTDSFECAKSVSEKIGSRPVIMNVVSGHYPGGEAYRGNETPEEDLYRRSNYGICLPFERKDELCPIQKDEIIWNSQITVIRDTNYRYLSPMHFETYPCCAVITSANPSTMKMIIENYFLCGLINGHRNFIPSLLLDDSLYEPDLSLLSLTKFYNQIIDKYRNYIQIVAFAIPNSKNRSNNHYSIFDKHIRRYDH